MHVVFVFVCGLVTNFVFAFFRILMIILCQLCLYVYVVFFVHSCVDLVFFGWRQTIPVCVCLCCGSLYVCALPVRLTFGYTLIYTVSWFTYRGHVLML